MFATCLVVLAALVLPLSAGGTDAAAPRGTISVVSSDDSRIVFLIAPATGAVGRVRAPDKIVDARAELSRDGTRIAIGGLRGLWIFGRRGGGARFLGLDSERFGAGWATWSPSGRHLAFERGESLYTLRLSARKPRKLFDGRAYAPDWSPTGNFIVFVRNPARLTGEGTIQSIGTGGRTLRSIVRGGHPDVSPDGTRVAFARADGVHVVRLAGGKPRLVVRDADNPEWSPDGKYLAFTRVVSCSEVGCNGRVFVIPVKGGRARALGPPIFEIGPLSWSR